MRQIIGGIGQRKGSRLVLHAANESGLRAASFGLLCNLSSHGPDGGATAILQVGGARAALAEAVLDFFREKLQALFPKARILASVHEWDSLRDTFALLIAPVKGKKRIRVKVEEYVRAARSSCLIPM